LRNHFKTFAIAAMIAMVSFGAAEAKSSSFSSRSYSSPSYSSSSRSSSYSSPSYSSPSAVPSTNKYSGPSYKSTTSGPITATRPIGPAPNSVARRSYYGNNVYVHHDSFLTNPFFWLWASDRHQTVYVNGNGGAQAQYGAPQQQYAPDPISTLINWIMFLVLLGIIGWAIWFFAFRNKDRF
jgi:hypothetical protein